MTPLEKVDCLHAKIGEDEDRVVGCFVGSAKKMSARKGSVSSQGGRCSILWGAKKIAGELNSVVF